MSILIKGMEMPKSCEIIIRIDEKGEVYVYNQYPTKIYKAIPVPQHGRLIDADALEVQDGWLRDSKYFAQESSHTHITFVYRNDIYNAPTVIPADKDGEP